MYLFFLFVNKNGNYNSYSSVNMRIETILRICDALHITPDEILTAAETGATAREEDILARLRACGPKDKQTALQLLDIYLRSLSEQV